MNRTIEVLRDILMLTLLIIISPYIFYRLVRKHLGPDTCYYCGEILKGDFNTETTIKGSNTAHERCRILNISNGK